MTVRVQWDDDPVKTGLSDSGQDSKVYASTETSGRVTITREDDPTRTVTVPFNLPLPVESTPSISPDKTSVDSGGDAPERTITISGTGFPASTAGTVALHPGAPGSGGTAVTSTPLATDASGGFTGIQVVVPAGQEAGDYHLVTTVGTVINDDTGITVTSTPAEPAITPDKTSVDSAGDAAERTITVTGTGFPASTAGNVALHPGAPGSGGTAVVTSPVTSDASGGFTGVTVAVPEGQAAGDYHLVATIGAGVSDDTGITVTNTPVTEPTVTPDVTTVDVGGTVTVTGADFPASTAGRVGLYDASDVEVVGADVTTDASGAIAATPLVVPDGTPAGDLLLRGVVGDATSADVTITVTVPAQPVLSADKDTLDSAGDETERTVTVTGADFPASTAGRVGINTGAPGTGGTEVVGADVTTDASGAITATPLVVPADQAAGDYHVTATVTGATVDDLALTITNTPPPPDPTVTPDVTTVVAGGTVTVTGADFPASTAGRVGLFDSSDVEVVGADVTTDASGAIAATPLVVPAGTAAGEYQLNGVVGEATSADVAITVTAALAERATSKKKK